VDADDPALRLAREHAARLVAVPGIVAVVLGGSRATGRADGASDVDLGLYRRGRPDVDRLRALADSLVPAGRRPVAVTEPGAWGPWVDGGAWLHTGPVRVDWIYRDLDRVAAVWADCRAGRVTCAAQVGHPHGFWSSAYAGELALGVVLADPTGEVGRLRAGLHYPPALSEELVRRCLWEAGFGLAQCDTAAARGDVAHVAGHVYQVVGLLVQALHAGARQWLLHEKGGVEAAAALPGAPQGWQERVGRLLGRLGTDPATLAASVAEGRALLAEVRAAVG